MFESTGNFSKFGSLNFLDFSRFLVVQGLGGGNISNIVPRRAL